jgi:hypothetical protein
MTRLAFTEFDAFAEVVRDASMTMRMCSREVTKWTLQYATSAPLAFSKALKAAAALLKE